MAFAVAVGDRIAQLVLEKIETPPILEVDVSVSVSAWLDPLFDRYNPRTWTKRSAAPMGLAPLAVTLVSSSLEYLTVSIPIYHTNSVRDLTSTPASITNKVAP